MKNNFYDLILVGNGPSGINFLSALEGINHNLSVAHINSNMNDNSSQKDPFKNLTFNSNQSKYTWKYQNKNADSEDDEGFFNYVIFNTGGLTSAWGAGCCKYLKNDIGVNINLAPYYLELDRHIEIINYTNNDLDMYLGDFSNFKKILSIKYFHSPFKAIKYGYAMKAIYLKPHIKKNVKGCNLCEGCNVYCFNNAIYNAGNDYINITSNSINKIENSYVLSIEKKGKFYFTKIQNFENKKTQILKCSKLVFAAGTINTTKILIKYLYNIDAKISSRPVKHNEVIRGVFFNLYRHKKIAQPVGTNIANTNFNKLSSYTTIVFGSHVACSDLMSVLPFKNFLLLKLLKKIKKYIIITLTFYPSETSTTSIQLHKLNKFKFVSKGKNIFYLLYSLSPFILSSILNLIIPIFFQKLKPGSDLHHGGTFPIGKLANVNTSKYCELNNHPNLYIIDGSWLPRISEKPHTYTLMANARRIAKHIAKEGKN